MTTLQRLITIGIDSITWMIVYIGDHNGWKTYILSFDHIFSFEPGTDTLSFLNSDEYLLSKERILSAALCPGERFTPFRFKQTLISLFLSIYFCKWRHRFAGLRTLDNTHFEKKGYLYQAQTFNHKYPKYAGNE